MGNPTSAPTTQPTAVATEELILKDCYEFCNISTRAVRLIQSSAPIALVQIARNFTLRFAVRGMQFTDTTELRANIIDLRDGNDGSSLLALYMTENDAVELRYMQEMVYDYAYILAPDYAAAWTVFTIAVNKEFISISSDISPEPVVLPLPGYVDTYGHLYEVYTSFAGIQTSGGWIRDIELSTGACNFDCYCLLSLHPNNGIFFSCS
jgi:hypothetical protein